MSTPKHEKLPVQMFTWLSSDVTKQMSVSRSLFTKCQLKIYAAMQSKEHRKWNKRPRGHIAHLSHICFSINICKYDFPYCSPSRLRGAMVWTILNLHYIRKLSCKYDIFRLSGSGKKYFQMTPPHFCIFVIISPLKKTWPLIWTILTSLYPRMTYAKFDRNWPAGSGEEDFFQYKHM